MMPCNDILNITVGSNGPDGYEGTERLKKVLRKESIQIRRLIYS